MMWRSRSRFRPVSEKMPGPNSRSNSSLTCGSRSTRSRAALSALKNFAAGQNSRRHSQKVVLPLEIPPVIPMAGIYFLPSRFEAFILLFEPLKNDSTAGVEIVPPGSLYFGGTGSKPKKQVAAKPPRDASGKFLTGTVLVAFILNAEGRVIDPFIIRSPNPLLNAPVLDAIKQCSGTPARLDGSRVPALGGARYAIEKPPMPKWVSDLPGATAIDAKGERHLLSDSPSFMEDVVKKVQPYRVNSDREHDGDG